MSRKVFDQIKGYNQYPCVTIILPTHRTAPDNKQDEILLKNLISKVNNRLSEEFNKRDLSALQQNLDKISEIEMNHNKEGLVIFVSEEIFTYAQLMFTPEERVVIDDTFATRELVRESLKSENYYVLTLGRDKVRLFEGFKENMTEVTDDNFPVENISLSNMNAAERAAGSKEDDMIEEFFNRVDKTFQEYYKDNPADVILAGIDRNTAYYRNISDRPKMIVGSININGDSPKAHELAADAWPVMKEVLAERQEKAISILDQAVSEQKFESDLNMIWKAIQEGRGDTFYAEEGYYQPAIIKNETLHITDDSTAKGVKDDIIDEISEQTIHFGGKVIFVKDGALAKYHKAALITRY